MSVSIEDVRHIATLARLAVDHERAAALVDELNAILGHMDRLSKVNTDGATEVAGIGAFGLPLRADHGPAIPLERHRDAFAPEMRDGFFLVPRLATHESAEES